MPETLTEYFSSKYLLITGSKRKPHVQATFLLILLLLILLIRVSLVSNGEEPVKTEISDAPTVSCLALTHSALFWIRPVSPDLRKALKA